MASTVRMLKIYAEVLEAIAKLVPTLDAESSNCKPIYNLRWDSSLSLDQMVAPTTSHNYKYLLQLKPTKKQVAVQ